MDDSNELQVDAPASCPGPQSESAGKDNACAGCPNQAICSSGAAKLSLIEREPEVVRVLRQRLGCIKRCLFVLSGKGGVGKSSVSVCLSRGFSRLRKTVNSDSDDATMYQVGLLDLDLCGPSIPCFMGCMNAQVHQSVRGWSPVFVTENLKLMSLGFLVDPDQAIIWRGPRKHAFIRDILLKVAWDEGNLGEEGLDFFIIDTPPGTSDEHLSAVPYVKAAGCPCAAIIVTTPQELALSDVRKEINFCRKIGLPILGIVENMVSFDCPKCGVSSSLFPETTGGASSLCDPLFAGALGDSDTDNLCLLGRIPLDPRLTRCLDDGHCPFEEVSEFTERNEFGEICNTPSSSHLHQGLDVIHCYNSLMKTIIEKFETVI